MFLTGTGPPSSQARIAEGCCKQAAILGILHISDFGHTNSLYFGIGIGIDFNIQYWWQATQKEASPAEAKAGARTNSYHRFVEATRDHTTLLWNPVDSDSGISGGYASYVLDSSDWGTDDWSVPGGGTNKTVLNVGKDVKQWSTAAPIFLMI